MPLHLQLFELGKYIRVSPGRFAHSVSGYPTSLREQSIGSKSMSSINCRVEPVVRGVHCSVRS
jgi:hypothetical protein